MTQITINGVLRDLSHLQDFIVTITGKGKDGSDLRVAITLGRHTYSTHCAHGQHDLLDENGKPRKFCEDRYAFSLGLPELAKRMVKQNYYCWESKDNNNAINYALIDVAPGRMTQVPPGSHQVVFFYMHPHDDQTADVHLTVVSCYNRELTLPKRRLSVHSQLKTCLYGGKRIP